MQEESYTQVIGEVEPLYLNIHLNKDGVNIYARRSTNAADEELI